MGEVEATHVDEADEDAFAVSVQACIAEAPIVHRGSLGPGSTSRLDDRVRQTQRLAELDRRDAVVLRQGERSLDLQDSGRRVALDGRDSVQVRRKVDPVELAGGEFQEDARERFGRLLEPATARRLGGGLGFGVVATLDLDTVRQLGKTR